MKKYHTIFKSLAILLTLIVVSCSQDDKMETQTQVAKSKTTKSARATYDPHGNLFIENGSDLVVAIVLEVTPNSTNGIHADYLATNFQVKAHDIVEINNLEAISTLTGDLYTDTWEVGYSNNPFPYNNPLQYETAVDLVNGGVLMAGSNQPPAPNNDYAEWRVLYKGAMTGQIENPNHPQNPFVLIGTEFNLQTNQFPNQSTTFAPYAQSLSLPSTFDVGQNNVHITISCTVDSNGNTHLKIEQILNGLI